MKLDWKLALLTTILMMITLPFLRDYLLLKYPLMTNMFIIIILFLSTKIMGSLLEIIYSLSSYRFFIDDFLEELFIFIIVGFACWLFIIGAEIIIGGKVEYAIIPPVAYFLINSLYREVTKDGRKLV